MTPALELTGVSRHYGSLRAVDDVSFPVVPGARHAVIGPNGAGKSTLFGVVAGTIRPSAGRVVIDGRDVTGLSEPRRAARGVAKTFQHSSLFLGMTCADNVAVAVQRRAGLGFSMLRSTRGLRQVTDPTGELLERVGLPDRADVPAAALSHGERRQLEVALALATEPRLLLLDEPTAGMSAAESDRFSALVEALPTQMTVLLIEHDLDVVFRLATHVTVLHVGRVLADGSPDQVRASAEVQEAYLGAANSAELFLA